MTGLRRIISQVGCLLFLVLIAGSCSQLTPIPTSTTIPSSAPTLTSLVPKAEQTISLKELTNEVKFTDTDEGITIRCWATDTCEEEFRINEYHIRSNGDITTETEAPEIPEPLLFRVSTSRGTSLVPRLLRFENLTDEKINFNDWAWALRDKQGRIWELPTLTPNVVNNLVLPTDSYGPIDIIKIVR